MIIYHLNTRGVYHRDLKPSNFLVQKGPKGRIYVHLSDFGKVKNSNPNYERDESSMGVIKGTEEYLPPEVLEETKSSTEKPPFTKQDVWAIGVIAYQLCTFRLPFVRNGYTSLKTAIIETQQEPINNPAYSQELKNLIDRMLTKKFENRPSIQELYKTPLI